MKVAVVSRSGREVVKGGIQLADSAKVADLQEAIHAKTKKYYPARQRLTLPVQPGKSGKPVVLSQKASLSDYCEKGSDSLTVVFKDLGPQIYYSTLFFWEYVGPLLIYPMFYYLPVYKYFGYEGERVVHPVQTYAMYYFCFHYFKRIMETFFVHRFSHATSPVSNVFRNCAYYWTFGAYIAYYCNHPLYTPVSDPHSLLKLMVMQFLRTATLFRPRPADPPGGADLHKGLRCRRTSCALSFVIRLLPRSPLSSASDLYLQASTEQDEGDHFLGFIERYGWHWCLVSHGFIVDEEFLLKNVCNMTILDEM